MINYYVHAVFADFAKAQRHNEKLTTESAKKAEEDYHEGAKTQRRIRQDNLIYAVVSACRSNSDVIA